MDTVEFTYDSFSKYFPYAPTALCIKECARLEILKKIQVESPILDVGCGDGLFAKLAFGATEVWGIDIDGKEGRWAQASQAYSQIILGDITTSKLPSSFFKTCVANCSLEHVPDIQGALSTIANSLAPGGRAYLLVPNRIWASKFMTVRILRSMFGKSAAAFLQDGIDEFFRHHHLYDENGWRDILAQSPLSLLEISPALSTATTVAFEAFLLPSIAGWANKKLTTRWTNFPGLRSVATPFAYAIAKTVLAMANDSEKTAEFLIVAERKK